MRGSKRRHLTAPECEALARSAEGSAPLRRPLSLAGGGGGGGGSRGLHPIHGTRRHPRGAARQRNILEFFGIQERPDVGTAGMENCGIGENPVDLDPVFPGSQESFRSRAQNSGIRQDPVDPIFPGESFRSRAQRSGIKEDPMDPIFPGESFRSRAQSCEIKEDPMDPIFPGESFRSRAQNSGIRQDPMDPVFPGESFRGRAQSCEIKEDPVDPIFLGEFFRSRAQSCGIRQDPMDPVFPGSGDSFRSRAQHSGIKEDPMDPVFPGSQESFRSRAQRSGIKEDPMDPIFPESGDSFRSTQRCGIKEDPMDPVFPGSGDSFRSRAQRSGIKEEPLDLDPIFPESGDSFRSRAQHSGIKEDPMDPIFPESGDSFRSTQRCGIKEDPMDPVFPGSQESFRSRAQHSGIKEEPLDSVFPGSGDSLRSRAQSPGIKEEPLDLDPIFPESGDSFRSRAQHSGIKEDPMDPIFPGSGDSLRSTQRCGIKEDPMDPIFPGSGDSFRSRAQRSGIKEDPMDPVSPGSGDSLRSPSRNPSPFPRSLPAPRAHSRKRPLPSAASGIPSRQQDPWEEPEEKMPSLSGVKQEMEELEVEPLPDSHFGLLGTRNWDVPQGSLADLPAEILRNIFAFLPVLDLYQSLSLVCRCWREIIQDPLFIPWKKLYHRYLKREERALQRVEQILQEFSITKERQECVLGLVRLVSRTPTDPRVDPDAVLQDLGGHPLFPKARFCVLEKFPDLMSKPGPEKMWATLAVMVLFSDSVGDIRLLLERLRSPRSQLGALEVTEALHCMATLLFAMRDRRIPISNRIHYNIFYCLYLMENASGIVQPLEEGRVDSSGWADVRLTHEQQRILNHRIEPGQTVKIMALAGTGKTSTLVKYAEKFPELKFLYLAFNKAVAEKGKKVFPRNVTCKTFHSLAYGSVGRYYKEKGKLNFSKMSVYSISFLLSCREHQSLFVRGKTVSQTLENFFSSSDEEICEEHTPLWFKNTHGQMQLVSREEKRINVEEAREIWRNMKKLDGDTEKKYKMTCDGYLKLWQLSKPQLSGFDAIFVDEAQDCTPAIADIVQSQKCGKILVGDPHQQIYTFRGAVNTLYTVPHTHLYFLTQSFRFGPEIAYVGSTILDVCKEIRSKNLLGGNQSGDVRAGRAGPVALLSRSNWNVFEDAVKFSGRQPPAKIHVIGGLERFGLNKIHDIWKLRQNSALGVADPFVRSWAERGGFWALKEYAERADDRELEVKISIVEKYGERIPELVARIRESHVSRESLADFLIGTAHQAKGLEFDTVWVADDFVQIPSVSGAFLRRMNVDLGRTPEDEWNLLYVAATRAKKCLLMSKSLENLLALAGERFLRVELLSEAGKDKGGAPITCCMSGCTKSLEFSSGLVVKKLPLAYSDGSRNPGGFLCQACTWQFFGPLTALTSFLKIQNEPIQL